MMPNVDCAAASEPSRSHSAARMAPSTKGGIPSCITTARSANENGWWRKTSSAKVAAGANTMRKPRESDRSRVRPATARRLVCHPTLASASGYMVAESVTKSSSSTGVTDGFGGEGQDERDGGGKHQSAHDECAHGDGFPSDVTRRAARRLRRGQATIRVYRPPRLMEARLGPERVNQRHADERGVSQFASEREATGELATEPTHAYGQEGDARCHREVGDHDAGRQGMVGRDRKPVHRAPCQRGKGDVDHPTIQHRLALGGQAANA